MGEQMRISPKQLQVMTWWQRGDWEGIICDGAKASCAAKIATAVDAGILGYNMYKQGQQFRGGDGIVVKGIEATLKNIGRLGKEGMKETNEEIIKMMIGE